MKSWLGIALVKVAVVLLFLMLFYDAVFSAYCSMGQMIILGCFGGGAVISAAGTNPVRWRIHDRERSRHAVSVPAGGSVPPGARPRLNFGRPFVNLVLRQGRKVFFRDRYNRGSLPCKRETS